MHKIKGFTLAEVLITLGIIGVVAALTLPSIIQNYQKKVTVERLKKTYSTLAQAIQMSVKDNDDVETWDFSLSTLDFTNKYILPYVKDIKEIEQTPSTGGTRTNIYALADGTTFYAWSWVNPLVKPFVEIVIDTNGTKGPNVYGKDVFIYYIFSQVENGVYNGGTGDVATKVPRGGLYPDGYGYSREELKNNSWRGCNKRGEKVTSNGAEHKNVALFARH